MMRLVRIAAAAALFSFTRYLAAQPLVYVADPPGNAVTVVDSGNNSIVRTLPNLTGANAIAIRSDGSRVYVTEPTDGKIAVFDGTEMKNTNQNPLIKELDVGGEPTALALSPDEQTLYVADAANDQVEAIDLNTGNVAKTYSAGSGVSCLALSPDGHLLVIGANDKTLTLYSLPWLSGESASETVVSLSSAPKALQFGPAGRTLWIATGAGYASYDRSTGAVSQFATSGGTTSVAYDVRQGVVYFGAGTGHLVYKYTPGVTGLGQIGVYGPVSGLALSPDGTRLYATQSCSNCGLAVVNTLQGQALTQVRFGNSPATAGQFAGPGAISAQDGTATESAGNQASGSVSATDGNGRALSYSTLSPPAQGQLDFNSTGDYTYTPPAHYSGLQSFVWQASASGGQGSPTQPRSRPVTTSLAFFPTLSAISNQTADPGQALGPLAFTITGTVPLTLTVSSTDGGVVSPKKVVFSSGCGLTSLSCSATITVGNASGSSAKVTIQARDPSGLAGSTGFTVTTTGIGPGHSSFAPLTLVLLAGLGGVVVVSRRRHGEV